MLNWVHMFRGGLLGIKYSEDLVQSLFLLKNTISAEMMFLLSVSAEDMTHQRLRILLFLLIDIWKLLIKYKDICTQKSSISLDKYLSSSYQFEHSK